MHRIFSPLKTCFIVNPRSGRARHALLVLQAFAARHAWPLQFTERPRHAADLTRAALDHGYDRVVAVGGDGTMNEIAGVLTGSGAVLGLVPCGSGDGLGRHLGVHGPVPRALALLVEGRIRLIDTGVADGHPFFTAAGIGFEAEIARRFNQLARRGLARYLSTSARAFRQWEPEEYAVSFDGRTTRMRAFTLAVANANQYGNEARIAPQARLDDGRLDLCVVPPVHAANALPLLLRLFRGTLGEARGVLSAASTEFVVERPKDGPLHTDGEVHEAGTRLVFSVRPASLRVVAPPE